MTHSMKLTLSITFLAASAAFSQEAPVAAKPPKPTTTTTQSAPALPSTAKLWRLVAKTQALRQQADQTQQAKDAKVAEEELQAEQAKLQAVCGTGFVLGYDNDAKSSTYQDLTCQKAPEQTAKADPPKVK